MEKPYVWQMIKEAINSLNGKATYAEIKQYIYSKWDSVNESTINAQLIVLSVNQPSRIHYPENQKPRISNSQYDLLFSTGRGKVVKYDPEEHGIWEIHKSETGNLIVRQTNTEDLDDYKEDGEESFSFPIEASLRDFLIRNLNTVKERKLKLFVDENGREGKEYNTDIGRIDILTTDKDGNFYVFELKVSKGVDRDVGQLLRYMGWVKKNLAGNKKVKGIIVANKMDEKIKYAVLTTPDITLYEYEMKFELSQIKL